MNGKILAKERLIQASREIPAYKLFLKENGLDTSKLSGFELEDFPVTSKNNYFHKYPLGQLFVNNRLPMYGFSSSGSSGKPTFWFRGHELDDSGIYIHEFLLKHNFKINPKDPTLVLVCFSMGIWIAGMYTSDIFRLLADKSWKFTVMTPGLDKESIAQIISKLGCEFKNIILAGHPPFLMNVLTYLKALKVTIPQNCFLLTAGDKHSEMWRNAALNLLQKPHEYTSIANIYGASDAGAIAFETPLSLAIKQLCEKSKNLKNSLMSELGVDPAIFQYKSEYVYIEEIAGELVITAKNASPLLRYNIHDLGKVLSAEDMIKVLKANGVNDSKLFRLFNLFTMPFVIKGGRKDVALTYYALNLYPEQLLAWRNRGLGIKATTGNFVVFKKYRDHHKREALIFRIEVIEKFIPQLKIILPKIKNLVLKSLEELSPEFRKLINSLGASAYPKIELVLPGKIFNIPKGSTGIAFVEGKKARVIF